MTNVREEEFKTLLAEWNRQMKQCSCPENVYLCPAYRSIVAMGASAIPLVLNELKNNRGDWLYTLRLLARENVAAGIFDYQQARTIWLNWGYKNKYIQL